MEQNKNQMPLAPNCLGLKRENHKKSSCGEWMEPEVIMLREISQTEKDKYIACMYRNITMKPFCTTKIC
jgi:hypothetical protein